MTGPTGGDRQYRETSSNRGPSEIRSYDSTDWKLGNRYGSSIPGRDCWLLLAGWILPLSRYRGRIGNMIFCCGHDEYICEFFQDLIPRSSSSTDTLYERTIFICRGGELHVEFLFHSNNFCSTINVKHGVKMIIVIVIWQIRYFFFFLFNFFTFKFLDLNCRV